MLNQAFRDRVLKFYPCECMHTCTYIYIHTCVVPREAASIGMYGVYACTQQVYMRAHGMFFDDDIHTYIHIHTMVHMEI
jgi:hypothetical protein